jgi:perosamine synthetase
MTGSLPFIPVAEPDLTGNEARYLQECIESGWVSSQGSFVRRLEREFGSFIGVPHVAAVSSGTAALHLALIALGIGPGDEVIVPSLTFIATANAVRYVGAVPVFADCDPVTWTLSPEAASLSITPRTKAIIPVHLYGHPAHMDELAGLTRSHGLYLIEDAAEAHGALYKGTPTGALSDIAVFSLFGNKVITSGEGGLVATSDEELDTRVRLYRDQGLTKEARTSVHYWHEVIGFNYGMSNLQAAVALAQLERIEHFVSERRRVARRYESLLCCCPVLEFAHEMAWARSNYWMPSVLLSAEARISRNDLIEALRNEAVDTRPFFYPIHRLPPYDSGQRLPITEDVAARGLNLPTSSRLSDATIHRVADTLLRILGCNGR